MKIPRGREINPKTLLNPLIQYSKTDCAHLENI